MYQYLAITYLLALVGYSSAGGPLEGLVYAPAHASADYYAYPSYAFDYSVNDPMTGDNKLQWEKRDGDVVKGAYALVEPDGSLRLVEYWADDKSGFNAVVKRIGPSLHRPGAPHVLVRHVPIYRAPLPLLRSSGPVGPITVGPVAKIGPLAAAPVHATPIKGGVYPATSLLHAAPLMYTNALLHTNAPLHTPALAASIIKSAPILTPKAPIKPFTAAPIRDSDVKAPVMYLPLNDYSGLKFIGAKEPLLNTWHAADKYYKYIY